MRLHSLDPGVARLRPHPDIDCGVAMLLAALLAGTDAGLVLAALLATACASATGVTAAFTTTAATAATAATATTATTAEALGHDGGWTESDQGKQDRN
jgi:hypothetical protein